MGSDANRLRKFGKHAGRNAANFENDFLEHFNFYLMKQNI